MIKTYCDKCKTLITTEIFNVQGDGIEYHFDQSCANELKDLFTWPVE